jgi:excisionase family DNA binding protein
MTSKTRNRTGDHLRNPFVINLLTIPEVAARLKVETSKVDYWLAAGAIPSFDFDHDVRISERDLAIFIMARRVLHENVEGPPFRILPSSPPCSLPASRLVRIGEAAQILGIGRSKLYAMISTGEIATVKLGRRRLVRSETLEKFVVGLKDQ